MWIFRSRTPLTSMNASRLITCRIIGVRTRFGHFRRSPAARLGQMQNIGARVVAFHEPVQANAHINARLSVDDVVDSAIHDEKGEEKIAYLAMSAYDDELETLRAAFPPKEVLESRGHIVDVYEERLVDDYETPARCNRVMKHVLQRSLMTWIETQVYILPQDRREIAFSFVRGQDNRAARIRCGVHVPQSPPYDDFLLNSCTHLLAL